MASAPLQAAAFDTGLLAPMLFGDDHHTHTYVEDAEALAAPGEELSWWQLMVRDCLNHTMIKIKIKITLQTRLQTLRRWRIQSRSLPWWQLKVRTMWVSQNWLSPPHAHRGRCRHSARCNCLV